MIYFLVCMYNEAENIQAALCSIADAMRPLERSYCVQVIDDASTDDSVSVVQSQKGKIPVTVHTVSSHTGLAGVYRCGLERWYTQSTDEDLVFIWEGDNTNDGTLIVRMLSAYEKTGSDIVCASRYIPGAQTYHVLSLRNILSALGNTVLKHSVGITGITDYTHIPRLYSGRMLRRMIHIYGKQFICSRDFAVTAEMLVYGNVLGARITEVPHEYKYYVRRGKSNLNVLYSIGDHLRLIGRIGTYRKEAIGKCEDLYRKSPKE